MSFQLWVAFGIFFGFCEYPYTFRFTMLTMPRLEPRLLPSGKYRLADPIGSGVCTRRPTVGHVLVCPRISEMVDEKGAVPSGFRVVQAIETG